MGNLTLKVKKVASKNLKSQEPGFDPRVVTNGTADFGDIAKYACKGSTISTPEMEASSKLFCEAAAEQLENGMIVDLGPLGKLYPSVSGKWAATKEGIVKSRSFHDIFRKQSPCNKLYLTTYIILVNKICVISID